jgi:hypothetical protein
MPIAVTCPHCGLRAEVPDEATGLTARCMRCRNPVSVPSRADAPLTPTAAREEELEVAELDEEGAPRRWLWWAVSGGAGVLLLGGVLLLVLLANRPADYEVSSRVLRGELFTVEQKALAGIEKSLEGVDWKAREDMRKEKRREAVATCEPTVHR